MKFLGAVLVVATILVGNCDASGVRGQYAETQVTLQEVETIRELNSVYFDPATQGDALLDAIPVDEVFDYANTQATQMADIFKNMYQVFNALRMEHSELFRALKDAVLQKNNALTEKFLVDLLNSITEGERGNLSEAAIQLRERSPDGAGSILLLFSGSVELYGFGYGKDYGLAINLDYLLFPSNPTYGTQTDTAPLASLFTAEGVSASLKIQPDSNAPDVGFLMGYDINNPAGVGGYGIDLSVSVANVNSAFGFDASSVKLSDPFPDLVAVFFMVDGPDFEITVEADIGLSYTEVYLQLCGDGSLIADDEFTLDLLMPYPNLNYEDGGAVDAECPSQASFWRKWAFQLNGVGQYLDLCDDVMQCDNNLYCNTQVSPSRCDNIVPKSRYALCDDADRKDGSGNNIGSIDCDDGNVQFCNLNSPLKNQVPGLGQCNRKADNGWLAMCSKQSDCGWNTACDSTNRCRYLMHSCLGDYYCASGECIKTNPSDWSGECSKCSLIDKRFVFSWDGYSRDQISYPYAQHRLTLAPREYPLAAGNQYYYVNTYLKASATDHREAAKKCGGYLASYSTIRSNGEDIKPNNPNNQKDKMTIRFIQGDFNNNWLLSYAFGWSLDEQINLMKIKKKLAGGLITGESGAADENEKRWAMYAIPVDFRNKDKYPLCEYDEFADVKNKCGTHAYKNELTG